MSTDTSTVTFVVRWESDSEGVSYDMPSMVCTVEVPNGPGRDMQEAAYPLVAQRIVDSYPNGPSGAEAPIEPSWIFEDDPMCMVEAIFKGTPELLGEWAHSETI
ncbi:hypothetical protein [Streptomyces venezuelae]|uniref:hypothetical protein n=1 Tax=Streptomyces venezuelae TaxID=54571 RepID=UPI0037B113D2